jgi:FkbM family methyltransferase
MNIKGIIHVGAHYGEEFKEYLKNNIKIIHGFEPVKKNYEILVENVKKLKGKIKIYPLALGNKNQSKKKIYLSNNNEAQSSSFLKPLLHLDQHPEITFDLSEIVKLKKLDDFKIKDSNYMSIDVQGFELEVLKGAKKTLRKIDYIYCEVNTAETYKKNPFIKDIDNYLKKYNFLRVETFFSDYKKFFFLPKKKLTWGDALYIKDYK